MIEMNAYDPPMKIRSFVIPGCLTVVGLAFSHFASADDAEDKVRGWRSASGTIIKGELIAVRDGKAIIRPETKLIEAPLSQLAKSDRELALAWEKKQIKILADREEADLLLAKSKPMGKALIDRTLIRKGKGLVPYNVKNTSKLDYLLVYVTSEGLTGDVDTLNRLYKRLKNRYDNFEFVAIAFGDSSEEVKDTFLEAGVEFPVSPPNMLRSEGAEFLRQLYSRKVAPQIAILDSSGQIVSDSYREADAEAKERAKKSGGEVKAPKQDLKKPLDDFQKLLRDSYSTGE
ncbi:MAG: hypothetical protein ACI9R3_002614 [Verrucomicrobiales bacterium]|jgi:hypothetical protein